MRIKKYRFFNMNKIYKIIIVGQVGVNLIVILIIFGMRFILTNYFDFRGLDAGVIGVIFAWIFGAYL